MDKIDVTPDIARQDEFLERLLKVPQIIGPRLSLDGKWMAWIWAGLAETTQLWLAPADGGAAPRRLVADEWDVDSIAWAPDSTSIIYGRSKDGDERVGLHQVFLDGTPARALTEDRPDYYIRGGRITRDGKTLVFAANVDPETGQEIEPGLIYAQDVATGKRRLLARPERAAFCLPIISPDDRHVLYERNDRDPAGYQLWLTDIEGSFDREIVNVGDKVKVDGYWSPDGSSVVVTAEASGYRKVGLWRLGGNAVDWLIDDPKRQIADAIWPPRSPEIVIEETQAARAVSFLLDPTTGKERVFASNEGTLTPLGMAAGGEWIASHYSARHPGRLVRVRLEDRAVILDEISRHPSADVMAPEELIAAEDFRWRSNDGLEIQGWLYRAKGEARGTILHIHGGPTYHYEDEFMIQPQYYTRLGFNVLQPNYRGSTGFALDYQESIKQQGWGGAEQADIRTGAEALIKAGIAASGKIGITGTSYGGYSSWWAITQFPPEIVKAAAPICGMTDLVVDYDTTRPDLRPYSEEMMGGTPKTVPQRFFERSPINFVGNIKGRLLIVQGANDPNVTPQNVADVRARLDALKIPYEVLVFEDEGHGISKPGNRAVLYRRLAHFFAMAFQ
jgi:dipeptidyl aminopeptidase/acylaminoacyl peptidase